MTLTRHFSTTFLFFDFPQKQNSDSFTLDEPAKEIRAARAGGIRVVFVAQGHIQPKVLPRGNRRMTEGCCGLEERTSCYLMKRSHATK